LLALIMENSRDLKLTGETVPPGPVARIGLNALLLSLSADYRGAGANGYIYHLLRHLDEVDGRYHYTTFLSGWCGNRLFNP